MLKNKAFTIIELLVVIAIIGLISSLALLTMDLPTQRQRTKIAKALEFSQTIQNAIGIEALGIWNLDNNASDTSNYGNNGTISGTASFATDTPQRIIGQGQGKYALILNGSNGYVSVPDSNAWFFGTADFTITLWVKYTTFSSSYWLNSPIAQDQGGGANPKWIFGFDYLNNQFRFDFGTNGGTAIVSGVSSASLSAGTWYQITFTRSGNAFTWYLNGNLIRTVSNSGSVNNINSPLTIGFSEGTPMNGLVDEVHIYNQALTTGQIQKYYAEGSKKYQNLTLK